MIIIIIALVNNIRLTKAFEKKTYIMPILRDYKILAIYISYNIQFIYLSMKKSKV